MHTMFDRKDSLVAKDVASALAVWSSLVMLVIWIAAHLGIYTEAANMMSQWHMFFDLSISGLIGGMVEAAVISFIGAYTYIGVYNFFAHR